MDRRPPTVERLAPPDLPRVVSALSSSFFDYPVMRYVLGPTGDYGARLRALVTFFVQARIFRDETLLGVWGERPGELAGAAIVSRPGSEASDELDRVRERTWERLGPEARARYETFGEVAGRFSVDADHLHLNMVGVRPEAQGRGVGRALLDTVHDLSASDPTSTGVTLSTETESNLPLYEHFGYEVIGSAPVEDAFTTWAMFRPDQEGR